MESERDALLVILRRVFGDRVDHWDHSPNQITVREAHTCYEGGMYGGARERDLEFEFDADGNLENIWVN